MGLKRNLQIVWSETASGEIKQEHSRRFIAKALNGGPGWGVWDRKTQRFMRNKDISRRSAESMREVWPEEPSGITAS